MRLRRLNAALGITAKFFACVAVLLLLPASSWAQTRRPNILLIVTDDQRYGSVAEIMPTVQSRIFTQGVTFEKAYVTTSACCPSRSTVLTGLYAHNHGVRLNTDSLRRDTIVNDLQRSGYRTALIGKYLNSWDGSPRSEFDFWVSFKGGSTEYVNPKLFIDGVVEHRQGYMTDLLADQAVRFLNENAGGGRPFFLMFTPNAPHAPAQPDAQDLSLFTNFPLNRPPSYLEADRSDKPEWLQAIAFPDAQRRARLDRFYLNQLRTLRSVDRGVARIIAEIERQGLLDSTVIFFISDNGLLFGEHGLESKDCVYEEAVHVPFAVRAAGMQNARSETRLVGNIDIAPTIYEFAQLRSGRVMDGASLVPVLKESAVQWREALLLEGWRRNRAREPFVAAHSGRYIYVENGLSIPELYDLENDPFQLENAVHLDTYDAVRKDMQKKLARLLGREVPDERGTPDTDGPRARPSDNILDNTIEETGVDEEDAVPIVPEDVTPVINQLLGGKRLGPGGTPTAEVTEEEDEQGAQDEEDVEDGAEDPDLVTAPAMSIPTPTGDRGNSQSAAAGFAPARNWVTIIVEWLEWILFA